MANPPTNAERFRVERATDEQIERVRKLASLLYDLDTKDRIALAAVLEELAATRVALAVIADDEPKPGVYAIGDDYRDLVQRMRKVARQALGKRK